MMLSFLTKKAEETYRLGEKLGKRIFSPSLIALVGELGSGKTVFTQGIGEGLGVKGKVRSPSFVIINEYPGNIPLYHFDLYRISQEELKVLGYEEYFYTPKGVVVIEWANVIPHLLPPQYLEVRIKIDDFYRRKIAFIAHGSAYKKLLERIKRDV
ncbi:tRNA (adenosine(37)-N6)-threonylcarbamoyltransferase complex ATPase subunit type 1 TsaE [Candidatus Aerophobetes bacterium]|nr:tRNA (adenosine(37)-N6)-threonylcarbamoyltransferase complex ATPase subunit type 1 TsaE [Candidatus Aerophobetes bacterium]